MIEPRATRSASRRGNRPGESVAGDASEKKGVGRYDARSDGGGSDAKTLPPDECSDVSCE